MNAKEYDMMIFIGAGKGFPGSCLVDVELTRETRLLQKFWKTGEDKSDY